MSQPDRPNPRPVQVDETGQIREMDGTPFIMFAPEMVRKSIADLEAGRFVTLDQFIAERNRS